MSTARAIRTVFTELRRVLGPAVSATDALLFANELVRFYTYRTSASYEEEGLLGPVTFGRAFEEWPVDVAMLDGGWMVLEYEMDQCSEYEIGRGCSYDTSGFVSERFYIGDGEPVGLESERIFPRTLCWLMIEKRSADKAHLGQGYDEYTSASLDGLDF